MNIRQRIVRRLAVVAACLVSLPDFGQAADLPPRTYSQEIQILFSSAAEAAQATLKPLPVLDGKPWALSARWDDNHPGNLLMHDVMAKHGLKGTFYLSKTDDKNRFGAEYVTKLLQGGFSIGGHTQTHAKLTEITPADLFYEILANRVEREAQADMPIVSFAPPYGLYDTKENPQAIVRITETLKRSGYHHITYHGFRKDNPGAKPGDFSSCLMVTPGDHEVDAAKFQEGLAKILRFESAYKQASHDVTLATHARQTGAGWDELDKLYAAVAKQQDWWFCNQNEYAAYERQVHHTKIERVARDGASATFRLTRPVPSELGASVPLTVEVQGGSAKEIRSDVGHDARVASGRTLINLAHSPIVALPRNIDVINNDTNGPATVAKASREIRGFGAWLTIDASANKATLALANSGDTVIEGLHVTLRLPLAYQQGLQRITANTLRPGEKRTESYDLGPASSDPALRDGRRYCVAEIEFRRNDATYRLFATATTDGEASPVAAPQATNTAPVTAAPEATTAAPVADASLVPFVIPTDIDPVFAFHGRPIAVDSPRVVVKDGQFHTPAGRLRIWGVNLCWAACFPSNRDAQRIARRLESFGVNSVRFHHMDYEYERFPKSIWDKDDPNRICAEALDRLDYFIDQLARRGIYSNLNLHVSRIHSRHLDLPETKAFSQYDKVVDLFTPQLIDAQQKYARELLSHVNRYRGKSYAQDPAIAFVEINNEDSFFMNGVQEKLGQMPPFYEKTLTTLYNQWLVGRHGSKQRLAGAWAPTETGQLPPDAPLGKAQLLTTGGAEASASASSEPGGHRVQINRVGSAPWHIEYFVNDVPFRSDCSYAVTFRARADTPRQVTLAVREAVTPWRSVGLRQNVSFTTEWKTHRLDFRPLFDEPKSRISILCGQNAAGFEIADLQVTAARPIGLAADEDPSAGNVAITLPNESAPRTRDRLRFFAELEKKYYGQMKQFLRQDLGCSALLTGTSVYGILGLWAQSDMDYIDSHSYWAHPLFPGASFDQGNWNVDQASVADSLMQHNLLQSAALRLSGKPYAVSEYNHAAPNDYQAETVPTITALAAAQDWDAVWIFSYSGALDGWDVPSFTNHFDIQSNPSKWAFMPAGAALYRDGGLRPLASGAVWPLASGADPLDRLTALHANHALAPLGALRDLHGLSDESLLRQRIEISFTGPKKDLPSVSDATSIELADGQLIATGPRGMVAMQSPAASPGMLPAGKAGAVMVASLDDRPLAQSESALLVACGRCENPGMGFSPDRRTVGTQWGQGPVHVEPLLATIPWPTSQVRVTPLTPDGRPDKSGKSSSRTDGKSIQLSPDDRTIWYHLQNR